MIRELIDTELEVVAGGFFDTNFVAQSIDAHQTATANANAFSLLGVAVGGAATAVNVGGSNSNVSLIGR
jgi:hypothetical protein